MYRECPSGLQILEIEVTNRCNLRCKHCYVEKDVPCDLPKKKVLEIIDEANEMGVNRLIFTGGEPLLYKEIFEVASYAKKVGIPQAILFTNGLLIKDEICERISKCFDHVQLSIDVPPGHPPSLRTPYSNIIKEKILLLKSYNIKVSLMATLHKSLLPKIEEIVRFARSFGVKVGFNRLHNISRSNELKKEELGPKEIKEALEKIQRLKKLYKNIGCSDPMMIFVDKKRLLHLSERYMEKKGIVGGCMAGIAVGYISSTGDLYPCPFVKVSSGNIFEDSLKDIWYNSKVLNKFRDRGNISGCKDCKFLYLCGGCRAEALIKGDLFGKDPTCIKDLCHWVREYETTLP